MHGILDSADGWIANYQTKAPAFNMCQRKQGYDVWLANSRGTKYSLGHTKFDYGKDSAYWDFSFAEMGKYDLPAIVEYILDNTDKSKLTYMGHSQGSTQILYSLAEK